MKKKSLLILKILIIAYLALENSLTKPVWQNIWRDLHANRNKTWTPNQSKCIPNLSYTQYCLASTKVIILVLVVLIFSQNFSTNGPYVVLNFCKGSDSLVLYFAKKSYTAGKFTAETENSASIEEVMEVGIKCTKNV